MAGCDADIYPIRQPSGSAAFSANRDPAWFGGSGNALRAWANASERGRRCGVSPPCRNRLRTSRRHRTWIRLLLFGASLSQRNRRRAGFCRGGTFVAACESRRYGRGRLCARDALSGGIWRFAKPHQGKGVVPGGGKQGCCDSVVFAWQDASRVAPQGQSRARSRALSRSGKERRRRGPLLCRGTRLEGLGRAPRVHRGGEPPRAVARRRVMACPVALRNARG